MLSNAQAHIKPNTIRLLLLPPIRLINPNARRRCVPDWAMATEIIKPPSISKIKSLPNALATSSFYKTPVSGKNVMGISEVAGIGIGSKIHQTTHKMTMAAVQQASAGQPEIFMLVATAAASSGPQINTQNCLFGISIPAAQVVCNGELFY